MFTRDPGKTTPQAAAVLRQAASNANPEPAAPAAASVQQVAPATAGETIPLSKTIQTHQGPKSELVLRAPTFTDYIELGDIDTAVALSLAADGKPEQLEVRTNHEAIMRWASALTGHDRVVLSQLAPRDAGALIRAVRLAIAPFTQGNSPAAPTS